MLDLGLQCQQFTKKLNNSGMSTVRVAIIRVSTQKSEIGQSLLRRIYVPEKSLHMFHSTGVYIFLHLDLRTPS